MAELIVYGIVLGSIITLGAIGLSLVYGILRFAHFAHGDFMTLGAYCALLFSGLFAQAGVSSQPLGPFSFGFNLLLSFLPAVLLAAGVALGVDRFFYRRLRKLRLSPVLMAMASLAIAFVIRSIVYITWGPDFHFYVSGLRTSWDLPFGIKLRPDQVFILGVVVILVVSLHLFLGKTKIGKALRATADNPDLARVSGINTDAMVAWTWTIGIVLASVAGILLGIDAQVRPEMGWAFLIPLFAAVILGGIGSFYGALLGGLTIGIVQQVSTQWLLPSYKPAVAFSILILMLLFRPRGLLGGRYGA
ncbi:MAG: branched-chain amino acid ABC transporter permease [Dehalococcoidales bacterium]